MARLFAEYELPGSSEAAGPLIDAVTGDVVQAAKKYGTNNEQLGASIRDFLAPKTGQYATCQPICVVFPQGSKFTAASLMAGDGSRGVSKCQRDGNGDIVCGVGYSSWDEPEQFNSGDKAGVCATFRNWSHDRQRAASLTVFFIPPSGTKPKPVVELR
jgi:hypothetical protein